MRNRLNATLLMCTLLLNGCGQKGPLYLPKPEEQQQPEQQEQPDQDAEDTEPKEN